MKIVFFGDSITDGGRNREDEKSLGTGYVRILADKLRPLYPESELQLVNKGVSGDEVGDLLARMKRDVLDLKPDAAVVMAGVNNVIHQFKTGKKLDFAQFESDFTALLRGLKNAGVSVILFQPYLLPAPEAAFMRPLFEKMLEKVDKFGPLLSEEFVALDEIFNGLSETVPYTVYSLDGVHPTYGGAMLIADLAIKALHRRILK